MTFETVRVALRNWWAGAFGKRRAFVEGGLIAFDNAAMVAHDMGRPDIREAINEMRERWGGGKGTENAVSETLGIGVCALRGPDMEPRI